MQSTLVAKSVASAASSPAGEVTLVSTSTTPVWAAILRASFNWAIAPSSRLAQTTPRVLIDFTSMAVLTRVMSGTFELTPAMFRPLEDMLLATPVSTGPYTSAYTIGISCASLRAARVAEVP